MFPVANGLALFFTVAMLIVTAYFFLGSVPLLILKHYNPVDASFIRAFYNTYYRIAFFTAVGTAASFALAARPAFSLGAAGIALLTWTLRRRLIPKMEQLGTQIQTDSNVAIPTFRKIHKAAILINLAQLAAILGSLAAF